MKRKSKMLALMGTVILAMMDHIVEHILNGEGGNYGTYEEVWM